MKNLRKVKTLETNAPEAMKAFSAFDKAARFGDAIPRKYKEPMKLAAAFTTQRPTASKSTWARRGRRSPRLGQPPVYFASDCPYFGGKDLSPLVC
ncbi:MAG: hypothetical protein ACRD4Q_07300 [Candidatus Acidiferrales bacterium]